MRVAVIIQLKQDSTLTRVQNDVPNIIKVLTSHGEKAEMIFRSNDGLHFGWFISISKPLRVVLASITNGTSFRNDDCILMFEVGEALEGLGFSRQGTWLQRTPK